jgi:hypothetical protein
MVERNFEVKYHTIKPSVFKDKESYDKANLTIERFNIVRVPQKDKATILIIYNEMAYKQIYGKARFVYQEAKRFLSEGQDAALLSHWVQAGNVGYWSAGVDHTLNEYDIAKPNELIANALKSAGLSPKEVSKEDYSTLYKVLKSEEDQGRELTRTKAIKFGKDIGVDPASLMFNQLKVPLWGTVNLSQDKTYQEKREKSERQRTFGSRKSETINKVYQSGRIAPNRANLRLVTCPRDLYRQDVRAISINSPDSIYDGMIAYYHMSNKVSDAAINKLCVVGYRIDNSFYFGAEKIIMKEDRSYLGIYRVYGTQKKLFNPDPNIPEKDLRHTILADFKPSWVAPVISLVREEELERDSIPAPTLQKLGKLIREEEAHSIDQVKQINEKVKLFEFLSGQFYEDKKDKEKKISELKVKKAKDDLQALVKEQEVKASRLQQQIFELQARMEAEKSKAGIRRFIPDLTVGDNIIEIKKRAHEKKN